MTYKLRNKTDGITGITSEDNVIIRIADNAAIPKDEANIDYQAYLLWVSEGKTPDPAD